MEGLSRKWIGVLGLERRDAPDFYQRGDAIGIGPHSASIKLALYDLGLDAVFCIEGVPTIGFLDRRDIAPEEIDSIHRSLWNQGLMSLLLVMLESEVVAYSLVKMPVRGVISTTEDERLIQTLSLTADALELRELINSAESGRYWYENSTYFDPDQRVDNILLQNLEEAFKDLNLDLGNDGSQALLMQAIFIAYLEDRSILRSEVVESVTDGHCRSFLDILKSGNVNYFARLFAWLAAAFNGNVFNAPCSFEPGAANQPKISSRHLKILSRFRHGHEIMSTKQLRFWGYDFRLIPVAMISAVYDRFLKQEQERQNADGAFYTPMFLADLVVDQLWSELSPSQKDVGTFFDPACGSGIFLVRIFQRLVDHHCHLTGQTTAKWADLITIASRLHGGDINSAAVRIAAVSLYIALLERVNPPDLQTMIEHGRVLPPLYNRTFRPAADFFNHGDAASYDVIVGNPPWKGRPGQLTSAQTWAKKKKLPIPANDIAWAFVWKSLQLITPQGCVVILAPAMGILHNISDKSATARKILIQSSRVVRIINLSDLCFQLFDGAQRPTALLVLRRVPERQVVGQLSFWKRRSELPDTVHVAQRAYRFEYWVPKADLNLRLKRALTLGRADRMRLRSDLIAEDTTVFKRRLWTRGPDEKLLQYLKLVPPLSHLIRQFRDLKTDEFQIGKMWVIGQGFQPINLEKFDDPDYSRVEAVGLRDKPFLNSNSFTQLVLPHIDSEPFTDSLVRRRGFVPGFQGPHILIPQGVIREVGRVRAAYTDQSLTFEHSIQAISFPSGSELLAKVLTAILNSRLAAWFYFHETANLGTDRAKVLQSDLLQLPFSGPIDMPNVEMATEAANKLTDLMNDVMRHRRLLVDHRSEIFDKIDQYTYQYYGLAAPEVALIDDTFKYLIPAMQPRRSAPAPDIWFTSKAEDRDLYIATLERSLAPWFKSAVGVILVAHSRDLAILRLSVGVKHDPEEAVRFNEADEQDVQALLARIDRNIKEELPGNVFIHPDLRVVIGKNIYMIKPMQLRFWLRSAAIADAEQIAGELQSSIARHAGRE